MPPQAGVAANARPSRRELIKRVGLATGVLAGSALLGRAVWDQGGFGAASSSAVRQVRDYRLKDRPADVAELAIARQHAGEPEPSADQLVRRAIEAMGGMKRFVSRGDVVVVKPNIGWDRMPIHAANTNPDVVGAVVQLAFDDVTAVALFDLGDEIRLLVVELAAKLLLDLAESRGLVRR